MLNMIKSSRLLLLKLFSIFSLMSSLTYAELGETLPTFFYIGGEAGIIEPVVKKFHHKESNSNFTLKKTKMYNAKIGYSYYPQMAIEFSVTYQPNYPLHYILPEMPTALGQAIPKTSGSTKVDSNIYMLNLKYYLNKVKTLTPFVILGGGIAQVKIRPTASVWQAFNNTEYFRMLRHRSNCLAWQMGLGFAKEVTNNFSLTAAAKLQVAHSIRIKYESLNIHSGTFVSAKPIKKTIAVGEFGIGFNYRLPI